MGDISMKKFLSLSLALLLALALAACGGGDTAETGDGKTASEIYAEDGYGEGRIGDLVHSVFMDFTVNSAYTASNYNGHAAPEGKKVLVVNMTVKNTFNETLPMYDYDFQAQWTASVETDEYAWPITVDQDGNETAAGEQLPSQYELAVNESRTGTLVFDVPADEKDFSISHVELFDDNSEGDTFFVYFTAKDK